MITEKCNLIALAIYYDDNFKEEVAFLFNPTNFYYLIMPTKYFLTSKKKKGTLHITELKNAFFISQTDAEKKFRELRNRD